MYDQDKYNTEYLWRIFDVLFDFFSFSQNFVGHKDATFCGVFDGHGPVGHKVAQNVRDNLPSKLSSTLKRTIINDLSSNNSDVNDVQHDPLYNSVKQSIIQSFRGMDEDLDIHDVIDTFSSGTTAVTALRKV